MKYPETGEFAAKINGQELWYNVFNVPFVKEHDGIYFLKTIYPSRASTKKTYWRQNIKKILLTKEEAALEKEIENGEWVAVQDMAEEIKKYQSHTRNALNKIKKINIRISDWDYYNIKLRAVHEGLPYQTLVSSIIHKYLTGQMKTG